jgi:LysM domain
MRKPRIAIALILTWGAKAFAQTAPSPAPATPNAPASQNAPATPNAPAAQNAPAVPSGNSGGQSQGAKATAQAPVGGGNAEYSSSRPISGNGKDGFDLGPNRQGAEGGKTQYGGENGAMFLGGGRLGGSSRASSHTVRKGDTLWDICDFYFQNPYQWPRVWSYNAQIQNPHWIYPGDVVSLKQAQPGEPVQAKNTGSSLTDKRRQVSPSTIFLRNEGFIQDETDAVWGEITGSREDRVFLTDFDEIYIRILSNRDIRIGEELTIFRPVRKVSAGQMVEIQGTVRVDQWNPKERIARGRITETTDTIERGARVGPLQRRFDVVAPVRNEHDLSAHVVASLSPHSLYGQNQVIFVDAGKKAGLAPGNRMLITSRGDGYHNSLPSRSAAMRIAMESDAPADAQRIPAPASTSSLPEEIVAELRVISVREDTALCVVMDARREVEPGDAAIARKGY